MPKLNRIREVRLRQQLQVRSLARHLGVTEKEAREIERPENDVLASTLIQIATWLQVPVGELLVEDELSGELHRLRGFVVRVVKTCNTQLEILPAGAAKNLSGSLKRQALELLPEARSVGRVHFSGLRQPNEPGRIMAGSVDDRFFLREPSNKIADY